MNIDPVPPSPSFVEAVCYRPRMYTATGTLEEVCCFLNGFYSGMITHTRDQRLIAHANRDWYSFLEFVNSPRQGEPNSDWFAFYNLLRQTYPDDAAALVHILARYGDYRQMCQNADDGAKSAPESEE